MKKYLYTAGAAALALTMSGVPTLVAHAQGGTMQPVFRNGPLTSSSTGDHPALNPRLPEQPRPFREQENAQGSTTMSVMMPGEEMHEGAQVQEQERLGSSTPRFASSTIRARVEEMIQKREQMLASSTEAGHGNATSTAVRLRAIAQFAAHMDELFGSSTPAQNAAQLQQMIQQREQELQAAASSTAASSRPLLEHAAKVSLAVHALLSAKDLMGSSTAGENIANLAQAIQASLASTTDAQAQIQARGFWTKLFFGGDTSAANTLSQIAAQNQTRIEQITTLLNQASTSAEVKAELQVQLQSLESAQASTTEQANQQKGLWGLFSWRLF